MLQGEGEYILFCFSKEARDIMNVEIAPTDWLNEFKKRFRHNPKILFIGNVANNAYQNAKILRRYGIACDVLCNDYYHVMGSPEWEDAELSQEPADMDYPDWDSVNLNGFERPDWFVQAPMDEAVAYLHKKNKYGAFSGWSWRSLEKCRKRTVKAKGRIAARQHSNRLEGILFAIKKKLYKFISPQKAVKFTEYGNKTDYVSYRERWMLKIREDWQRLFPNSADLEWSDYVEMLVFQGYKIQALLDRYDIVVGYGASAVIPYFAEHKCYIAFEHGTVRYIFDEDNECNKVLRLAYANSRVVYNTNTDCFLQCRRLLQNASGTHFCGLHGIGMREMFARIDNIEGDTEGRFHIPQEYPVMFCPARFDLSNRKNYFSKGQEMILQAVAKLAREGYDFRIVFLRWGRDYKRFKKEVEIYPELKDKVVWTSPLSKKHFIKAIKSCDIILDQFYWTAYGAVAIESLACNHAVLLSKLIPEARMTEYFHSNWPIMACDGVDDIYNSLKRLLTNRGEIPRMAQAAYEWLLNNHNEARIAALACGAFEMALNNVEEKI